MTSLDLAADVLATYRITRVITRDRVTMPLRAKAIRAAYHTQYADDEEKLAWLTEASAKELDSFDDDDAPALAYFVRCPWCVGIYVGAFVAVARAVVPGWSLLARALALSAAAGLIETRST